jgi:hypothetical protein
VPWVQTDSLSFVARHDSEDAASAQRILDQLEDLRLKLEDRFEEVPGEVTVIVHSSPIWLSLAHPFLPVVRWSSSPAGRRYHAGWPMATELHVLNDYWVEQRAAGEDSAEALRRTAERMYVQIVIAANNEALPPPWGPRRSFRFLSWAWLVEGAAQYFSGQTGLFRAAVITRMRNGGRASFPPSPRDAMLLGGTVFELLDRTNGREACELLVQRLRKGGPQESLEAAFGARFGEIERVWRRYLRELTERRQTAVELGGGEAPPLPGRVVEEPDQPRRQRRRRQQPGQQPPR